MAKAFTQWTVLPHKTVERLADNLWSVEGRDAVTDKPVDGLAAAARELIGA